MSVTIISPNGNSFCAEAFKEWLLRKIPNPIEKEAFLLMGVEKDNIIEGSEIEFESI